MSELTKTANNGDRQSGTELGKTFVRVIGTQLDRFIEFEFSVNDEDLTVELVMPKQAFEEFCETQRVEMLPERIAETEAEGRLTAPEQRTPGLYRTPHEDRAENDNA